MEKSPQITRLIAVEQMICTAAGVTPKELLSRKRTRKLVDARHAIWLIAHEYLRYPYSQLGRMYERDHSTIMHGVQRIRHTEAHKTLVEKIAKANPDILGDIKIDKADGIKEWGF